MNKNRNIEKYEPQKIESKWQKIWEESKIYSPNMDGAKKPFYNLMMFPYPSAEGMHVGNMYAFTGSDIYGRFKRLQGFDVFEPIGLDGFGIHSENYAIKVGRHPKEQAKISEKNFYRQLRATGNAYDWSRTVETYDPDYYKWTQWIFIQLYKAGLAYRKKAAVNFCPSCKTVLADEQVIDGACERCGTVVEKRDLEQWFFKITKYADRLLEGLDHIDWSEKVKIAQRNWIGRKEGINIDYKVVNEEGKKVGIVSCFTTRPDTNFGATFVVMAPEYPFVNVILNSFQDLGIPKSPKGISSPRRAAQVRDDISYYVEKSKKKSEQERMEEGRKKTGVFTGLYAVNNLNDYKMSLYVSDFVLMNFGTGAVVGVPGHDKRDFEFAQEFKIPVIRVVVGKDGDKSEISRIEQVQEEDGTMINSEFLNGMDIHDATKKIMDYLEEKGWGKKITTYHLRDWLISRQRYWGPPIPMIYCEKCDWNPVKEEDLPILLPDVEDWRPEGTGKAPLANHPEFYDVACPECGEAARRETDVSDTFLDSSWYFLRYISIDNDAIPFPSEKFVKLAEDGKWKMENGKFAQRARWLPVDMYIGGAEHSVLHLLYTRFLTMVFKDLGLIDFEEPFTMFRAHGLIIAEGAKMSKSKGNVVNPDNYIKEFGADTLRTYLMFMGPFKDGGDFRDAAIGGAYRFLGRVWQTRNMIANSEMTHEEKRIVNRTIKKVTDDIENLRYNTAIASLMELVNFIYRKGKASKKTIETYLLLLSPFAPHITEELFFRINTDEKTDQRGSVTNQWKSVHEQSWPVFDKKYLTEEEVTIVVQVNGRVRDTIKDQRLNIKDQKLVEEKAKESERVKKHLEGKRILKVIYVEGKIINFVTE